MVNPERPTTPDSIAVHHILDAHVADPAFWKEFAADVLRPSGAWMRWPPSALVSTALMHAQLYRRRTMGLFLEVGTEGLGRSFPAFPTRCCATSACRKGSSTRSACLPTVPRRTLISSCTTSAKASSLDQLLAWSAEPGPLPRVPAGPDRGKIWDRISNAAPQNFARVGLPAFASVLRRKWRGAADWFAGH